MTTERGPVVAVRAAVAVLAASATVLAWTVWQTFVPDPRPAAVQGTSRQTQRAIRVVHLPEEEVFVAVASDPFHPERGRAPDAPATAPAAVNAGGGEGQAPRLLGTALLGGRGSFVVCQWPGEVPRVLRLGATVRDLTLIGVSRGEARFRMAGGSNLVVELPKPGA